MPGRLFAIGDVRGCSVALKRLIDAVAPRLDDTLVFLGDVIDYGPDSKQVIEQLIDLSRRCRLVLIEGNHESMLFGALEGRDDLGYWLRCGGEATLACYPGRDERELIDPEHLRFLKENCRSFYETDDAIFVHAGVYPNLPMSQQPDSALRWELADASRMAPHYSGKTVIAGHTCQDDGEVLDLGFFLCLDTNANRGGWLRV